jgi:hypothetical protein
MGPASGKLEFTRGQSCFTELTRIQGRYNPSLGSIWSLPTVCIGWHPDRCQSEITSLPSQFTSIGRQTKDNEGSRDDGPVIA